MHENGIQLDLWQLTIDYMNPVVVLTVESWSTIIVKGVNRWKLKRIWRREYIIMSILLSEKTEFRQRLVLRYKLFWSRFAWIWNKYSSNWLLFLVLRITCCVWFAETAGSVDITLLEKGVISRVPKSRARNKRRTKSWKLYNNYRIIVV